MTAIAWISVYILASCGLVGTPCLILFYKKNLKLEKENNDLMELSIKTELNCQNRIDRMNIALEKAKQEINDLKCQF